MTMCMWAVWSTSDGDELQYCTEEISSKLLFHIYIYSRPICSRVLMSNLTKFGTLVYINVYSHVIM